MNTHAFLANRTFNRPGDIQLCSPTVRSLLIMRRNNVCKPLQFDVNKPLPLLA